MPTGEGGPEFFAIRDETNFHRAVAQLKGQGRIRK